MAKSKIEQSLISQLEAQKKATDYNLGKVRDYMQSVKLVKELEKDIRQRGAMIEEPNSKGELVTKVNPAVAARQKELNTQNAILSLLGLQAPVRIKTEEDYL